MTNDEVRTKKWGAAAGITLAMRWMVGVLLLLAAAARGTPKLDVTVALGKNLSGLVGTEWPVDTDGNFFHGAEFHGPLHASVVLPGGKTIEAQASDFVLSQDDDTLTMAEFVFPQRESTAAAIADVREALTRWNAPIRIGARDHEEMSMTAAWDVAAGEGAQVFVRVQRGRGSIILRASKSR